MSLADIANFKIITSSIPPKATGRVSRGAPKSLIRLAMEKLKVGQGITVNAPKNEIKKHRSLLATMAVDIANKSTDNRRYSTRVFDDGVGIWRIS